MGTNLEVGRWAAESAGAVPAPAAPLSPPRLAASAAPAVVFLADSAGSEAGFRHGAEGSPGQSTRRAFLVATHR